jgi:hypothetical protein
MVIPEKAQADALQFVSELGLEREKALASVEHTTERLREACVAAVHAGASMNRVRVHARVTSRTLYAWMDRAGINVRAKASQAEADTEKAMDRGPGPSTGH